MVTPVEIGLFVLVLALLFGAYRVIKAVKPLIVNAIVGVIILFIANYLGIAGGIDISAIAILVCAVGGVPGAILVIILAYLDIAFVGMMAPLALL